jgi:hypothetical protein
MKNRSILKSLHQAILPLAQAVEDRPQNQATRRRALVVAEPHLKAIRLQVPEAAGVD